MAKDGIALRAKKWLEVVREAREKLKMVVMGLITP